MSHVPLHVHGGTLSDGWMATLRGLAGRGVDGLSPLVLTVDRFDDNEPVETPGFRGALSTELVRLGHPTVDTTCRTIFPFPLTSLGGGRDALFDRYRQIVPRLRKHKANKKGIYFERMIAFPSHDAEEPLNQLKTILDFWDGDTRRKSAFQVTTWCPERDLSKGPYALFPCLQHVAFTPMGEELSVTAFYATQYLLKRGYGNYLGLCRLGAFMAHEMGLRLTRFTCYAAHVPAEESKAELRNLVTTLEAV
ncbi:MAG: thymidylate synthase [Myxococcota bacterium]